MKSRPVASGQTGYPQQFDASRDDARGGGFLLAHQQLGALALGTNPSNGQTVTFDVNGTNVVATFVTSIGSTANNILIGASATASVTNLLNWLRRPDLTSSTQVAASSANQTLLSYLGYAWPGSSTNIVLFSLNKNVNGITGLLTSFNITTTVTSGSWTAQTMQLYVEDGTYYIGTTRVLFTGGSTPTVTGPVSHPRIDVLSINSSGTLSWTTGTENASPVAPTYPTGQIVICELYNVVSETALYDNENQQSGQGYISNDVRPTLGGTYVSSTSQVASGLFILDPGSEAQGDVLYYNGSAWTILAPGTSGYFLETQGSGANPQWASVIAAQGFISSTNLYSDTSSNVISSTSATKIHEMQLQTGAPTLTYTVQGTIKGYNSGTCYYQIYKNGTAVGTLHSTSSTTDVNFTDSISATSGDKIQLYAYASSGGGTYGYVDGFAILGFPIPSVLIPSKNS
jgi:hypothetical protein